MAPTATLPRVTPSTADVLAPSDASSAPARTRDDVRRRVLAHARLVKVGLVAAIAVVLLVGALGRPSPAERDRSERVAAQSAVAAQVARLMEAERCSYTGFGADVIPAKALLRTDADTVEVVSFARGWAAYEGRRPGTLVAVCLGRHASR